MKTTRSYLPILLLSGEEDIHSLMEKEDYILGIQLACPAGPACLKNIRTLIRGDRPFLLYLSSSTLNGDIHETLELVELCLFSQHYLRIDNSPVIAILPRSSERTIGPTERAAGSTEIAAPSSMDEDFFVHLRSQGWSSIVQWALPTGLSLAEQIESRTSPLLLETPDSPATPLQKDFLTCPDYLGSYVCFRDPAVQYPEKLEKAFADACASAVGENQLWEASCREYLSLRTAFAELSIRQAMLQEMLSNAESTISLIRTKYKEDYNLLFRWYHREYESLPLWYKRFGHILKVLTGQRSLRSIFDVRAKRMYHSH